MEYTSMKHFKTESKEAYDALVKYVRHEIAADEAIALMANVVERPGIQLVPETLEQIVEVMTNGKQHNEIQLRSLKDFRYYLLSGWCDEVDINLDEKAMFFKLVRDAQMNDNAVSYEQLQETLGWTISEFVQYKNKCEVIRAACIIAYNFSKYQQANVTVSKALQSLIKWLNKQLLGPRLKAAKLSDTSLLTKPELYIYEFDPNITYYDQTCDDTVAACIASSVYVQPKRFRAVIEADLLDSYECCDLDTAGKLELIDDGLNCSLEKAQQRLADVKREMRSISSPPSMPAMDDDQLDEWVSQWGRYHRAMNQLQCSAEELEEYIEKISSGSMFCAGEYTLEVYRGAIKCIREQHNIESVTGEIATTHGGRARLNIMHCKICNRFLIDNDEYEYYRNVHGDLICKIEFPDAPHKNNSLWSMSPESILHACGYNVNQAHDLSEHQRQTILLEVMSLGYIRKYEVMRYLHMFVSLALGKGNMQHAIDKWMEDLDFVRKLNIVEQDLYNLSDIRRYRLR